MKQGMLSVTVKQLYSKNARKFEVIYGCTLEQLAMMIRREFDTMEEDDTEGVGFEVGSGNRWHKFCHWDYLEREDFEREKGIQHQRAGLDFRLSNNPYENGLRRESFGTYDKTLFQLFAKDGIWRFRYEGIDGGARVTFAIELREVAK